MMPETDDVLGAMIDEERSMRLLSALDECRLKGVSTESMRVLVYETGAACLITKLERKEWQRSKAE